MAAPTSAGLPFAFRIGVTGTRVIPTASEPDVRRAIAEILGAVRATVDRAAGSAAVKGIYAAPQGRVVPLLRIVSPLAEGADRLVAEEALKLGYALDATLPFQQAEYERDFPDSLDAFRKLLAHAGGRVFALDGGRGVDEWRSYEAIGRHVVRNCDLLLAIWDPGVPAKGRGGTQDTIHFAAEIGLPIWWIDASGREPPALLREPRQVRATPTAPSGGSAWSLLEDHIEAKLLPPSPMLIVERDLLDRFVATLQRAVGIRPEPLRAYLAEPERRGLGVRPFDRLMHIAARGAPFRALEQGLGPTDEAASRASDDDLTELSRRASRLSSRLADRSRTLRLLAIGSTMLAAISLAATMSAAGEGRGGVASALILLAVACTAVLVERVGRCRERWTSYRLLADLARAQRALGWIGWTLPTTRADAASTRMQSRTAWIGWAVEAAVRAAPMRPGWLGGGKLAGICGRIERLFVAGQAVHHFNRRSASETASRNLANVGHGCAAAAGLCVLAAFLAAPGALAYLCLSAAIFGIASAAILSLRGFAGLDAMVEDSERMEALVESLDARLRSVDAAGPLASQELGVDLSVLLEHLIAGTRDATRRR